MINEASHPRPITMAFDRQPGDNHEDAETLYQQGLAFLYGTDVPKDYAKAAECFKSSCKKGHMPARRELGIMYASGQGVEKDLERAVLYLGQAADSLDPSALYHLGLMYEVGSGVEKDMQKAVRMLAYAAEMGFPGADSDAERVDAILTEQRNRNLRARPLLKLQISDVDVEAACCKPMLDALLAQDIVFIDTASGPALLGEDLDGMDAVLSRCPYCGAPVQVVPRDKKYRSRHPELLPHLPFRRCSQAHEGIAAAFRSLRQFIIILRR